MSGADPAIAAVPDRAGRVVALALLAQIATLLPLFLLGGLFPLARAELSLDERHLGLAVAGFFAAGALGSALLAGSSDRFGPWPVARVALALGGALCLVLPLARGPLAVTALMALAGLANGAIQPATNVALSRVVGPGRQGTAFGLKQASIPLATLCAGLAIPAVALTLGWAAAYRIAALLPLALVLMLPGGGASPARRPGTAPTGWTRRRLSLIGLMSGLGAGTANAMAAFLVTALEAQGLSITAAGVTLALGSGCSIAVRIGLGLLADAVALPLLAVIAVLLSGGALSYGLFAIGGGRALLTLATLLAFGMGWGWAGLSLLAIVRANPAAPGRASGTVQSGLYIGAVVCPLLFGAAIPVLGFPVAWTLLALLAMIAALIPALLALQDRKAG